MFDSDRALYFTAMIILGGVSALYAANIADGFLTALLMADILLSVFVLAYYMEHPWELESQGGDNSGD